MSAAAAPLYLPQPTPPLPDDVRYHRLKPWLQEFVLALGGRLQMKAPQVAGALGVSLGGGEGAGAPTPASSAPSAARGAGPLTVEQ
eukprot:4162275-Pyramimonas_sp.AAC.1